MTDERRWTRVPESLRQDMSLDDNEGGRPQEAGSNGGLGEDETDQQTDQDQHRKQKLSDIPAHKRPGRMAARSESLAKRALRRLEEEERQKARRAKKIRKREIQKKKNVH